MQNAQRFGSSIVQYAQTDALVKLHKKLVYRLLKLCNMYRTSVLLVLCNMHKNIANIGVIFVQLV